jgi:hypothetical protein
VGVYLHAGWGTSQVSSKLDFGYKNSIKLSC